MATIRFLTIKTKNNNDNYHDTEDRSSNTSVLTDGRFFSTNEARDNYIKRYCPNIIWLEDVESILPLPSYVEWILTIKDVGKELASKYPHVKFAVTGKTRGFPRLLHMGVDVKKAIKISAYHTQLYDMNCELVLPEVIFYNLDRVQVPPSEDSDAGKTTIANGASQVIKTSSYEWHSDPKADAVTIINPNKRAITLMIDEYEEENFSSNFFTMANPHKAPWFIKVDGKELYADVTYRNVINRNGMFIIL